jgi:hypothetical protein
MPESMKKADVKRFTSFEKQGVSSSSDYLPPSIKSSFSMNIRFPFSLFISKSMKLYSPSVSVSSPSKGTGSSYFPSSPSKHIYYPSPSNIKIPSLSPPKSPPYSPPYSPPSKPPYYPPYKSPPSKSPPYKPSSSYNLSSSYSPPYYPYKKKLEGVSALGGDLKNFLTKYKFREFKIPEIKL